MLLLKASIWIEDFTAYLGITPADPSSISFMASPQHKSPSDSQANQLPLTVPSPSPLPLPSMPRPWTWWLMVGLNILLLLGGQSIGTLLGKFYYDQGGSSLWIQTLTLSAAFPILYLPLLLLPPPPAAPTTPPPATKIAFIYTALGLIGTADSLMYSYGLLYLPVSTYSLVCATQLGFNAVFSYFINSEKFTPLTLNSVVLLTFSAALLGVQPDPEDSTRVSKGHYVLGFILTLGASATYSLLLSFIELTFDKVIKSQTFAVVLDMQIYTALVSTLAGVVGLFASGEWKGLKGEMEGFRKGRVAYVMTLVWTAVAWQIANVGVVGLIFEVSSLFSNVISTIGIPLTPVFAVLFLHDRMDGIKIISMLLAMWGFVSYFYQHYIEYKSEKTAKEESEVSTA